MTIGHPQLVALEILGADLVGHEIIVDLLFGDDSLGQPFDAVDELLGRNRGRGVDRLGNRGDILRIHRLRPSVGFTIAPREQFPHRDAIRFAALTVRKTKEDL
jgi:hypothetical protein